MPLGPLRLSDFRLNEPIGAGSTSTVFDATNLATGERVAIESLGADARASAELRERLAREAVILAEVRSRHVGRVLGLGYDGDLPFLVLERLYGETLDDLLKRETPRTAKLVEWFEELLLGIRDCHDLGIIHRDVKPANIFLEVRGNASPHVKLIDFGVARLREIATVGASLTSTHHLIGSMGYVAPEQFKNAKNPGPQVDLYAAGVVLFRSITGRLPFTNKSLAKVIRMKSERDPPLLSSFAHVVQLPLLDSFVATALARDPAVRFKSSNEMLEEWWRVVATLDTESPLTIDGIEAFDDEIDPEISITLTDPSLATAERPAPQSIADSDPDTLPRGIRQVFAELLDNSEGEQPTSPISELHGNLVKAELELSRAKKKHTER